MTRSALMAISCALMSSAWGAHAQADRRPGAPMPAGVTQPAQPKAATSTPDQAAAAPAPAATAVVPSSPAPAAAATSTAPGTDWKKADEIQKSALAPVQLDSPAIPVAPSTTPAKQIAPAPTVAAASSSPQATTQDDSFELKVKALEENVNELKEKIFRTKARLLLLQETVLGGDITAGAKAVLVHKNDMGASFVLESVSYALDGAPIFTRVDDTGELDKKKEIEIFNGRIVPGNHQISVKLQYHGSGFGVFKYLEDYKFKVQSSHTFNAEGGKVTTIKIVGYEKGNITTDLKDRPAVKYDVEVTRDQVKRASTEAPAEGKAQ
ncbi:MAG: dihydrolipoamide acetyltransferase [Deltaproteobacteria bacterium]|nr:dihydrolipoamide acetyltransferase [Deltaproteobacteria bacterium]